jgi:hypothetical protein
MLHVRDIVRAPNDKLYLHFREIVNPRNPDYGDAPGSEACFCASQFRPVRRFRHRETIKITEKVDA